MNKKKLLWILIPVILALLFVFAILPSLNGLSTAEATEPAETQPPVKQGLMEENGSLCFYENGIPFTGGYKELTVDSTKKVYFFQEDGKAFTGGLKEVNAGCYFFQPDGSALTDGWQTVNDATWYFGPDGLAAADGFLTIGDNLYYFVDHAVTTGGWFCIDDGYYYADENGVLATDTVVEGYKLDADGKSATKYRINQLVSEHTDPAMTEQEKIEALFNWVVENDMSYIRSFEHAKADWVWADSWVDDMATSLMDEWGGNCYRYAAFLGLLIHEATELPVSVYRGQTPGITVDLTFHGWCAVYQEEAWYIYDAELLKFTEYTREGCYRMPAAESTLHLDGVATPLYSGQLPAIPEQNETTG